MKKRKIIGYIIVCLIIIVGLIVWRINGFNKGFQYSSRKKILLTNYTGIEISDVESIASEVLEGKKYIIQPVETFGNAVSIVAEDITEDQKNSIIEKFNQKYGTDLNSDNVTIQSISFTRVKDVLKRFIVPGIITFIGLIIYFVIRFIKIGWKEVLLKSLFIPILSELVLFSLVAITRVPFGRVTMALGVGLYVIVVLILTNIFENKKDEIFKKSNNQN